MLGGSNGGRSWFEETDGKRLGSRCNKVGNWEQNERNRWNWMERRRQRVGKKGAAAAIKEEKKGKWGGWGGMEVAVEAWQCLLPAQRAAATNTNVSFVLKKTFRVSLKLVGRFLKSDGDHRTPRIPPSPPAHLSKIGVMVLACVIVLAHVTLSTRVTVLV